MPAWRARAACESPTALRAAMILQAIMAHMVAATPLLGRNGGPAVANLPLAAAAADASAVLAGQDGWTQDGVMGYVLEVAGNVKT